MQISLISVLATCLVAQSNAVAIAAPTAEVPAGYGVDILEWTVPTSNGDLVLTGTVEEVYAKALKADPDFEVFSAKAIKAREAVAKRSDESLVKRGDVICKSENRCGTATIWDGIAYLRRVGGNPSNGPGPGNCGRVSCSNNGSIWWCNDNNFTKVLPGYYNIADGAQEIVNRCQVGPLVGGQNFIGGPRDWNVVVQYSRC